MKFRIILFFILGFFLFNSLTYTHAQKRIADGKGDETSDTTHTTNNQDSIKVARAHAADSTKKARAYAADSIKTARKEKADSMMAVRKHFADSTTAIHKYHDSKHYKDSVAHARLAKVNALKEMRQSHMDSVKNIRKQYTDSLTAMRKVKSDSIKTIQKRRSDSLTVIRKYKLSKRYADSVSIVRHNHIDSVHTTQQMFRDSIAAVRKHSLDSSKASRKHIMDSVKVVRTKFMDSIKIVRKARVDSFAKIKADKEKLAKAKEKKKEESMKLKLELKMKAKHEKWTNKSMLKKKWSPMRRVAQNSFTHYNYYFNANKKMDEALLNMQRTKKENYDSLIGLYPYDPNRDSSLLKADMDSIVHKVSVAIQIHDPRVKWSNDLYLLLGEAYYYKGNYENASIAFRYIISADEAAAKKKAAKEGYSHTNKKEAPSIIEQDESKHKKVHNESILWLARTFTEAHQPENAESIMSLLESDAKLPEDLKGRLAIERAFAFLTEKNDLEAANQLAIAVEDNNLPNWLRMRAAFINGQLQQQMGNNLAAAASFERALDFFPKLEMDFYTRKYIAFNRLQAGDDAAEAMKPLKKVLNDAKYVTYYDQVYFVLGQLAVKANKNDEAITYFKKSTTVGKASKKQKGTSFAALGDVYYATAKYGNAKIAYDSAAKYAGTASKDGELATALQRSKGLAEISGPTQVIHDQDSLLALSELSKKEQQSVVRRYLRQLEQQLDDSIAAAENAGVTAAAAAEPENDGQGGNDLGNWYFSSPTQLQQGSADFKRKWGIRPLTDNWRRSAAIASNGNSGGDDDGGETGSGNKGNGLPSEESLMAKIPNTPQQKQLCAKIEERAYMLLAKAYVKQLEDYTAAIKTLDTMDARFPDNGQQEEALYLRYQVAMKQSRFDNAQTYAEALLKKFPHSQYASILRPKQNESHTAVASTGPVAPYFDETYKMIVQHQYAEAMARINIANAEYDDPMYKKRFEVAEAMTYAGMGNYGVADSVISKFLHGNPADTLAAWASTVKEYIKEVKDGGMPSWYKDWPPKEDSIVKAVVKKSPPAPKETPPPPPPDVPEKYTYKADGEHYCIIVMPGIDSKTAALKQNVKDFNATKFDTSNLSLLLDFYSINQGVLIVQKFPNATQAKVYMDSLQHSTVFADYKPEEVQVFIITKENYRKMFADKSAISYNSFYKSYYK